MKTPEGQRIQKKTANMRDWLTVIFTAEAYEFYKQIEEEDLK